MAKSNRRTPWAQAAALAAITPADRNRTVDLLRALSIFAVVLGHWLVAAPHLVAGELVPGHLLEMRPWTQWLTWGFQVMPIFFLVGGYANGSSWLASRRKGASYAAWLRSRVERLAGPVLPVLLVWAPAGIRCRVTCPALHHLVEEVCFAPG